MAQADFTRISSNIAALNTLNSLRNINTKLGRAQLRLATGKRINQASDDASGLTIALKMNARSEGLKVAAANIGDAKNMLAVAESGLQQIASILTEMKAKATAAASDTLGVDERTAIQNQLKSYAKQVDDIVSETTWNDTAMLDGTVNKLLQTGAGASDNTTWTLSTDHDSVALGVATGSGTSGAFMATTGGGAGTSFTTTVGGTDGTISAGLTAAEPFGGLTELESGHYKFRVADVATGANTGQATVNAASSAFTYGGLTGNSSATGSNELASGTYTLTIDEHTGTQNTMSYTVTDSLGNIVATYDDLDTSTGTANLLDTNGNALGLSIGKVTAAGSLAGETINFEYLGEGQVKMELYEVSGSGDTAEEQVVAVDANGTDDVGVDTRRSSFYIDAASSTAADLSYDTGVGYGVTVKAFANIIEGDTLEFNYTSAGDVDVDVSTSALATAYMTSVDSALTTVTSSLNGIGSLVARLDAKETSVGAQQVNTEAAYNRIMNADMAFEQVEASKYMILQQTAVAMLAQSNMAPQGILSLFR